MEYGFDVTTCLVEPDGCDSQNDKFQEHRLEGMNVGVSPPFIDWNDIDMRYSVSFDQMLKAQTECFAETGQLIGNTSAACYLAAKVMNVENPDYITLTIFYDHGLWYRDLINTENHIAK